MKLNTKAAKELLTQVSTVTKLGETLEFQGFLAGFNTPVIAHCTEIESGKFWQFSLFWNSVHIQDVVVERTEEELIVETV